jgi:aspartyl protease family protein
MSFMRERGGTFLHTLVWLVIIAGVTWLFYGYMEGELNPNRVPQVSGSGEIVLKRNRAGHFTAGGAINGHPVVFLVDTGATQIAVPQQLADQLELKRGLPIQLMTAAGPARGYMTRLQSVELASLHLKDASAIIAERLDPEMVLLGMNFLRQLEITQRGDELILRPLGKAAKR